MQQHGQKGRPSVVVHACSHGTVLRLTDKEEDWEFRQGPTDLAVPTACTL